MGAGAGRMRCGPKASGGSVSIGVLNDLWLASLDQRNLSESCDPKWSRTYGLTRGNHSGKEDTGRSSVNCEAIISSLVCCLQFRISFCAIQTLYVQKISLLPRSAHLVVHYLVVR